MQLVTVRWRAKSRWLTQPHVVASPSGSVLSAARPRRGLEASTQGLTPRSKQWITRPQSVWKTVVGIMPCYEGHLRLVTLVAVLLSVVQGAPPSNPPALPYRDEGYLDDYWRQERPYYPQDDELVNLERELQELDQVLAMIPRARHHLAARATLPPPLLEPTDLPDALPTAKRSSMVLPQPNANSALRRIWLFRKRNAAAEAMSTGLMHQQQDLTQLRTAIAVWEAKLMRFADKFGESPELLDENPTWNKLLKVRDRLRSLLRVGERLEGLDQTRM